MKFHIRPSLTAAAVIATAILAAGCTGSSDGGSGGGGSPGAAGSSLTLGWAEPPDTLNPATTGNRDVAPIVDNIFDTLIWLTPDLKPTPDLATKWTTSADGKTYTFDLRQGVKFHDGTDFNAAAVVANINYITAKSTQSNISLSLLGSCTKAAAVSTYQFTLGCTAPYAPLLTQLGEPYLGIQSPAAITKYGKDLGEHPVGTGPFSFVSYAPNQSVVLKSNPDYQWAPPAVGHNGPSKISKITFNIVTNSQARVGSLQSGQSQLIQEAPGVYYNSLKSTYTQMAVPISGMGIFAPINTSKFPTNSLAVRQAILYSVDKPAAIKLADAGVFPPLNQPLQGMGVDVPGLETQYAYNPTKAAQLLTGDGWTKVDGIWTKGGKQLTLNITAVASVPEYPLIAQAIQGSLKAAGMAVAVTQQAVPAWLAANLSGNMSLTPLQYVATDPDAVHLWFLPGQYYNWSHFTSPDLTAAIQKGQTLTDPAARTPIYQNIEQMIMDQALEMPIHQNQDLLLISKKLSGVAYSGGGFEYFYGASLS